MNPFLTEGESPETPCFVWDDFPQRVLALSGEARERFMLAAAVERACCQAARARGGALNELAVLDRAAQSDALFLGALLPACPPVERAVRLEQAQADFTAALCDLPDARAVRAALAFTLPEDADHLYRFSNLAEAEQERPAEDMTGGRCEITPGRPSAAAHRHPRDTVCEAALGGAAPLSARMAARLMALLKRQTAADYMLASETAASAFRPLFSEAALLEGQHAALYASLTEPPAPPCREKLRERYAVCWLYASLAASETDGTAKQVWARLLKRKVGQVRFAAALAEKREGAMGDGDSDDGAFPPFFVLKDHSPLCRRLLPDEAELTQLRGLIVPCGQLPDGCDYWRWQKTMCGSGARVPSHEVIERYIRRYGTDYRFERQISALERLQNRRADSLPARRPDS